MKHIFLVLAVFSTVLCYGETFYRTNGETAQGFVKRIARTYELAHPIIETNEWDSTRKTIIYFVPAVTDKGAAIIGYLLIPEYSLLAYRRVLIDTIFNEGGEPHIENVIFANADQDKERELIVMTSWPQNHPQAGMVGTLYGTCIFDNPSSTEKEYQLKYFKDLSDRLEGGFEGKRNKEMVKAEYKDVADLRTALRKMGY